MHGGTVQNPNRGQANTAGKRKEDGDATQTRQGTGMQMTLLRGNRDPSMGSSEIANVPGQYEGGQQRQNEYPEENKRQRNHLGRQTCVRGMPAPNSLKKSRKVLQQKYRSSGPWLIVSVQIPVDSMVLRL